MHGEPCSRRHHWLQIHHQSQKNKPHEGRDQLQSLDSAQYQVNFTYNNSTAVITAKIITKSSKHHKHNILGKAQNEIHKQ